MEQHDDTYSLTTWSAAAPLPIAVDATGVARRPGRSALFEGLCTMCCDFLVIWIAVACAYYGRYELRWVPGDRSTYSVAFGNWVPFNLMFSLVLLCSLAVVGSYRQRLGRDLLPEAGLVLQASVIALGVAVILSTMLPVVEYSRLAVVYGWAMTVILLIGMRVAISAALGRLSVARRVLVVGTTTLGKMVMQNLLSQNKRGVHVVGFVQEIGSDSRSSADLRDFGRFKCLGDIRDIESVIAQQQVDEVIVALSAREHTAIAEICSQCDRSHIAVKLLPDLFDLSLARVRMDHIAGIPLINVRHGKLSRGARWAKRTVDIVMSLALLLVAAPMMLLISIAIKLDSPGPVFVRQQRVGRAGKTFTFFKFRSMYVGAEHQREELAARQGSSAPLIFKDRRDPRRTRVGRLIRQLSFDELPQIINVLRGDMSLVGPRPPLPAEVAHYEPHHFKRLEVRGGITGLWQVSGRSTIESFEEIVIMDTYYIENWSLLLDLRILLRTVGAVISRRGAF